MLRTRFSEKLKQAMLAKEEATVSTLRLVMAAMKDRDIASRSKGNHDGIGDDEILSMMQTMIKQRQESAKMYEQGNRPELAAKELAEIAVIESFLPRQMNDQEIESAIDTAIAETQASEIKDMGRVMAIMKEKYAGQLDFGKASSIVKGKLAG